LEFSGFMDIVKKHVPLSCTAATLAVIGLGWLLKSLMRKEKPWRTLNVLITGSTSGLGKALAEQFIIEGHQVVITSRSQTNVTQTLNEFESSMNAITENQVFGFACDVCNDEDLEKLCHFALQRMETIDIWINNAGISQNEHQSIWQCSASEIKQIIETNLTGTILGCRAAIDVMRRQKTQSHIFNMDGSGSRGNATNLYAAYGASKAAIPQLMKTLVQETKDYPNIGIHTLSPGMVITDLLLSGNKNVPTLKIFNILAEEPETVAQWLVPQIRCVEGTGKYIKYLTPAEVVWRFATYWRRRNKFFDEKGNRMPKRI